MNLLAVCSGPYLNGPLVLFLPYLGHIVDSSFLDFLVLEHAAKLKSSVAYERTMKQCYAGVVFKIFQCLHVWNAVNDESAVTYAVTNESVKAINLRS